MSRSSELSCVIRNYQKLSQLIELSENLSRFEDKQIIDQIKKKWEVSKDLKKKEKKKSEDEKLSSQGDRIRFIDDHRITWEQFIEKHGISKEVLQVGLTTEQATKKNLEFGDNTLTPKKVTPWYIKLFHEFTTFFALLMWAGSAMSWVIFALTPSDPTNMYVAIVLIVVILLTGIITFLQNAKSDAIMEGFKNFIPQSCVVIRDGKEATILAEKLVTGDLLVLKEGQRIPADIRILSTPGMKVDNSSLTGEIEPLARSEKCDQPDKILETKNVAFFGTLCKEGGGRGIVFNIGDNTVIGQIANLASQGGQEKSPLRMELDRFILMITGISITSGVILFILGFILGYKPQQNFIYAIGIIVANVPEGLLPTITVSLAIAAKRLSLRKVLVKNLESVETLGSTSCICSDKTGTLTQNVMTVENLWFNLSLKKGLNRERAGPEARYEYDLDDSNFQTFLKAIILNTAAVFSDSMPEKMVQKVENLKTIDPHKYAQAKMQVEAEWVETLKTLPYWKREVIGDASETALIKFAQPISDVKQTRLKYKVGKQFDESEAIIPFNSAYKFALKVVQVENDPRYTYEVFLKGAPEKIWAKCKYVLKNMEEIGINPEIQKEFDKANTLFAKNGERVLGFARLLLPRDKYPENYKFDLKKPFELPFDDFCFIGLTSLIDPPKETVPDAIDKCKASGIKVIMVTGDQQLTATSIAKKIGIFDGKTSLDVAEEEGITNDEAIDLCDAIVVNGDMLTLAAKEDEGLPESERGKRLEKWLKKSQIVFARTSPAQKLYIVEGCQKLGHIVAVTGDGVNDSPAIHQADIGISMGITGSDVAKDSADMILLDDDFASIVTGVREGRRIFDNLKKVIAYMIALNVPELVAFVLQIVIGIPLPCNTILVLCLSVGTDIFPAIGVGFEEPEIDVMTRLPRKPNEHMVGLRLLVWALAQAGVIEAIGAMTAYYVVFSDFGFSPDQLTRLVFRPYFPHLDGDVFDPTHRFFGNTNVFCDSSNVLQAFSVDKTRSSVNDSPLTLNGYSVDYVFTMDSNQDFRMGFLKNNCPTGATQAMTWKACTYNQISPVSLSPVCYSGETVKYAQSAYFVATVFNQFINSIVCKTKSQSIITQPLSNTMMIFGWMFELALCFVICYTRPINTAFQARDVNFFQFGFYGSMSAILLLIYEEIRKFLIRNFPQGKNLNRPNWFELRTML